MTSSSLRKRLADISLVAFSLTSYFVTVNSAGSLRRRMLEQDGTSNNQAQHTETASTSVSSEGAAFFDANALIESERDMIINHKCDPLPIPHMGKQDVSIRQEYNQYFRKQHRIYEKVKSPSTFQEDDIFTHLNEGTYVLWGYNDKLEVEQSAYNDENPSFLPPHSAERGMKYVSPLDEGHDASSQIPPENKMEEYGDHVVFVDRFYDVFAHFFLDFVPYIAYLKNVLPPETRFLLADQGEKSRIRLEELDSEFAKRVDWIECSEAHCRNRMVNVKDGNLIVFHPKSTTRHMELLMEARKWILEAHPPTKSERITDPSQPTIVYYTRNHPSAKHGRAMEEEQEKEIINIINQMMKYYKRPEKLVLLDGTQSFKEQIEYFQNANFVVGAHGGGWANLLFTLPSSDGSCEGRTKVLEFLNNPMTPDVQDGSWFRTYFNLYSTAPWVEYHHILYVPPSNGQTTYVNLNELRGALHTMFASS